ncbi:hypothetical protein D9F63_15185 [Escherichia coli]|nr:hypothetical protein [Escherichia coli]MGT20978.1 hypothetical protein [Escherichia coli]MHY94191.1 hypothetical protein [Escherichia coli]
MWGNNGGIPEQWGKYAGKSRCSPLFSYLAVKGGGFHVTICRSRFFSFVLQKVGEPAREKKVGDQTGEVGMKYNSIFPDAVRGKLLLR